MTKSEIEASLTLLRAQHGPWAYDIPLPHGVWTRGNEGLPHTRLKRVVQIARDLTGKPLIECRVLDLGCLDGIFSIEFALQGAAVVGIEIREANIKKAEFARASLQLSQVSFAQDDVRNVTKTKYGSFDIILCSGILYHLDSAAVFSVIENMHEMSNRLAIIDTHVSLTPEIAITYKDVIYHGRQYIEHRHDEPQDVRASRLGASWDNAESFWPTRPSLINALANAGFSSVYECFMPAHLNFGKAGLENPDRCTFVAIKGDRVSLHTSPAANQIAESWPEGTLSYSPIPQVSSALAHTVPSSKPGPWGRLRKWLHP